MTNSDSLFDELSKSILVLFRALPEAYNKIITAQEQLDKTFQDETAKVYKEVQNAKDPIDQEFLMNQRMEGLRWEYREIMEEIFIDVMQEFDLVEMNRPPQYGVISQEQPEPQPEAQPQEQQPPPSEPEPEQQEPASPQQSEPSEPTPQTTELHIDDKPIEPPSKKKLRLSFRKHNE